MGKLEKVIVLTVLFVTAVILVVSMTVDDPLDTSRLAGEGAVPAVAAKPAPEAAPAPAPTTAQPAPTGTAPSILLSATATPIAPAPAPATVVETPKPAAPMPAGMLLKTFDGLSPSFSGDLRFYTWREGDTFRELATRYYGDPSRVTLLRRVNEDRFDVAPGEKVLVPVYDLDAPRGDALADAAPADGGAIRGPGAAATPASIAAGARVHVVKEGESLWKIAKAELGSGARWKEIFDANRDVLPDPEALRSGLKLRIP